MNAMQQAFKKAGFQVKQSNKQDKGWSATLSYKTYQALKAQGIME